MLRSVLFLSLLAAAAAAPRQRCPPGYFFATGFTPANSFDPYADLRYYNRGKPYFSRAARQKCRRFPVYMSDMLNFGAREPAAAPGRGQSACTRAAARPLCDRSHRSRCLGSSSPACAFCLSARIKAWVSIELRRLATGKGLGGAGR